MYSAIASSSSIASVGVVGAVIAASIDAMSDSRDAGVKLAPSRREAHGEISLCASGACICSLRARTREARGEGDSRLYATRRQGAPRPKTKLQIQESRKAPSRVGDKD